MFELWQWAYFHVHLKNKITVYKMMKKIFLIMVLMTLGTPIAEASCHPLPNLFQQQMIIGYGSLMHEQSKRDTSSDVSNNYPLFLKSYERRWNYQTQKSTYLGIKANPKSTISAAYFKVSHWSLYLYDLREKNYCRVLVHTQNLIPLSKQQSFPKGQYWVYIPKYPSEESLRIPPYYLEYYVKGCKKISQDYQNPLFFRSCLKIIPKKSRNL